MVVFLFCMLLPFCTINQCTRHEAWYMNIWCPIDLWRHEQYVQHGCMIRICIPETVHHGRAKVLSGDGQLGRQEGRHQGWGEPGVESTHLRLRAVSPEETQHSARARGKTGACVVVYVLLLSWCIVVVVGVFYLCACRSFWFFIFFINSYLPLFF